MEIWEAIQPHVMEIIIGMATIGAIIMKAPKVSKLDKLEIKRSKAHAKSCACEKKLHKAYEKEAKLDQEVQNYASGKIEG